MSDEIWPTDCDPNERQLLSRATIAILGCICFAMILFQVPVQPMRDICLGTGLIAIVGTVGLESVARRGQRTA